MPLWQTSVSVLAVRSLLSSAQLQLMRTVGLSSLAANVNVGSTSFRPSTAFTLIENDRELYDRCWVSRE